MTVFPGFLCFARSRSVRVAERTLVAFAEAPLAKGVKVLGKDLRGLDMPEGVERTQG